MTTCKMPTNEQFEILRIMLQNAIHKALSNMTIDEIKKLDWFNYNNLNYELDKENGEQASTTIHNKNESSNKQ